jgi:hypothetical protein
MSSARPILAHADLALDIVSLEADRFCLSHAGKYGNIVRLLDSVLVTNVGGAQTARADLSAEAGAKETVSPSSARGPH